MHDFNIKIVSRSYDISLLILNFKWTKQEDRVEMEDIRTARHKITEMATPAHTTRHSRHKPSRDNLSSFAKKKKKRKKLSTKCLKWTMFLQNTWEQGVWRLALRNCCSIAFKCYYKNTHAPSCICIQIRTHTQKSWHYLAFLVAK